MFQNSSGWNIELGFPTEPFQVLIDNPSKIVLHDILIQKTHTILVEIPVEMCKFARIAMTSYSMRQFCSRIPPDGILSWVSPPYAAAYGEPWNAFCVASGNFLFGASNMLRKLYLLIDN